MILINKIKSHPHAKPILTIAAIILLFIAYKIYVWVNTESTDNAYIEADISSVSAEINGVIASVLITENNLVKAGQIIAKIQDDDYKANLAKAEAALQGARHDIEMIEQKIKLALIQKNKSRESHELAEENFEISKINFKRIKELSKDNFASKQNLDNVKIAFEQTKSELYQAVLNMQTSHEELALLEIQRLASIAKQSSMFQEKNLIQRELDNTNICSPIDGVIGDSSLREGNYVRAGAVLFSVIPMDRLYVKANFKETQISHLKPKMTAEIIIDSESGTTITGTLRNISPATGAKFSLLPPANATGNFTKIVQRVPVLIDFTVPEKLKNKIVPGMSVLIKIRTNQTVPDAD